MDVLSDSSEIQFLLITCGREYSANHRDAQRKPSAFIPVAQIIAKFLYSQHDLKLKLHVYTLSSGHFLLLSLNQEAIHVFL